MSGSSATLTASDGRVDFSASGDRIAAHVKLLDGTSVCTAEYRVTSGTVLTVTARSSGGGGGGGGMSIGVIIGAAVGGVVLLGAIVGGVIFCKRKRDEDEEDVHGTSGQVPSALDMTKKEDVEKGPGIQAAQQMANLQTMKMDDDLTEVNTGMISLVDDTPPPAPNNSFEVMVPAGTAPGTLLQVTVPDGRIPQGWAAHAIPGSVWPAS